MANADRNKVIRHLTSQIAIANNERLFYALCYWNVLTKTGRKHSELEEQFWANHYSEKVRRFNIAFHTLQEILWDYTGEGPIHEQDK